MPRASSKTSSEPSVAELVKQVATLKKEVASLKKQLASASKGGGADPRVDKLLEYFKTSSKVAEKLKKFGL